MAITGIGLGVFNFIAMMYAGDGFFATCNEYTGQGAPDTLVDLFQRVGLKTNIGKTKVMIITPGKIQSSLNPTSYYNFRYGYSGTTEWKTQKVECEICSKVIQCASLHYHMANRHVIFQKRVINKRILKEYKREPVLYRALPSHTDEYSCPVSLCEGRLLNSFNFKKHFRDRYLKDLVELPNERVQPKCEICGLQMDPSKLIGHWATSY